MTDQKQDPEYLLGENKREVERLQKQHAWIRSSLNGKIIFAPVDFRKPDLKVLDVGCADGILLRDLSKQLEPSAELVGSDIMGSFLPDSPQGNIRFVQHDLCEPPGLNLASYFDFTHVRYVLAGAARVGLDAAVANLAGTLAPGGWLQIQEMNLDLSRPDVGTAWRDVTQLFEGIFRSTGMGERFASRIDESMRKAGLVNVSVEEIQLPMGKLLENEQDRKNSFEPFKITIPTLIQAGRGLQLDIPETVYNSLPGRFEQEALEQGITFHSLVICGQKAH